MCRTCVFQPVPAGVLVFRVPALVAAVGGAGAAGAAAIAAAGQQLQQSDVFTACCVRLIARVQCIYKPTAELIRAINTRCRRCYATGVQIMHTSAKKQQQQSSAKSQATCLYCLLLQIPTSRPPNCCCCACSVASSFRYIPPVFLAYGEYVKPPPRIPIRIMSCRAVV